ncbi:MAG TPA: DUF488 domain-containing protein [Gemmataceae bacterium]|nr:DUF488 domain-containing protein [Gemmataceae bacterium]
MDPAPRLFSIGHSNHDFAHFLRLLQGAGITAVADVRSSPFSQRLPQFNRPELERTLGEQDIGYAFLGDLLGGRPRRADVYDAEGRVDYERVRAAAWFHRGLDRLVQAMEDFTIAMLCAEEDPLNCHRGLLITPALVERGIHPLHLRGDGSVETTAALEDRLLKKHFRKEIENVLFPLSAEERRHLLVEAYRRQTRARAYRPRSGDPAELPPGGEGIEFDL